MCETIEGVLSFFLLFLSFLQLHCGKLNICNLSQVHLCMPVCVDVQSDTEAIVGKAMKLTCISCLKREEVTVTTFVKWLYTPSPTKGKNISYLVSCFYVIVNEHIVILLTLYVYLINACTLFLSSRYTNITLTIPMWTIIHLRTV